MARLYASEYPQDVSGLVLIDYTPYNARNALTDEQWELWLPLLGSPSEEELALYPDIEWFAHRLNLEQFLAAAPLKPMPLMVLSADEPLDLLPFVEDGTLPLTAEEAEAFGKLLFQAFVDARADLVSQVPGARQPQLVIDSVREVVNAARKKSCALGVKNHGQCVKAENHARR
jgi:pimeloyl-ACP methyl ester carboxylesterase